MIPVVDNLLLVTVGIPAEEANPPAHMGSWVNVNSSLTDPTLSHREVLLDMISCTLSIVDLRLGPAVGDHQAIALEKLSDSEDQAFP